MSQYEQMSAVSTLAIFDTTKDERRSFVQDVINRLGDVNPLDLHLQVKCLESILEDLKSRDEYKAAILAESDKYHEKKFTYRNSEITKMEAGVKYNFIMCGDAEWDQLNTLKQSLDAKVKVRETFLKTVPASGMSVVDKVTGEVTTIYPPQKTSTSTVSVKLL